MARLFADENFPLPAVDELRRLGHDVETTSDAGLANRAVPDDEVLRYAIKARRAVLTLNRRDFFQLSRQVPHHSGIIACTRDEDFILLASRIHAAIHTHPSLDGLVIRINLPVR